MTRFHWQERIHYNFKFAIAIEASQLNLEYIFHSFTYRGDFFVKFTFLMVSQYSQRCTIHLSTNQQLRIQICLQYSAATAELYFGCLNAPLSFLRLPDYVDASYLFKSLLILRAKQAEKQFPLITTIMIAKLPEEKDSQLYLGISS